MTVIDPETCVDVIHMRLVQNIQVEITGKILTHSGLPPRCVRLLRPSL